MKLEPINRTNNRNCFYLLNEQHLNPFWLVCDPSVSTEKEVEKKNEKVHVSNYWLLASATRSR